MTQAQMTPAERAFYRDYGQKVAKERARIGLTLEELADKLGLTPTSIGNIERGQQRVFLHTAHALQHEFAQRSLGQGSVLDRANDRGGSR